MKHLTLILLVVACLLCCQTYSWLPSYANACNNTQAELLARNRPQNDYMYAINYVINDFLKSSMAKDSTISGAKLIIQDSLDIRGIMVLPYHEDEQKWPLWFLQENIGLSPTAGIPTEYIERSGKLFIWSNIEVPLTQNMIDVLIKHNRTLTDNEPWVVTLDDGNQYVCYFCKSDYRKHKKRFRRLIFNKTPCLRCK